MTASVNLRRQEAAEALAADCRKFGMLPGLLKGHINPAYPDFPLDDEMAKDVWACLRKRKQ